MTTKISRVSWPDAAGFHSFATRKELVDGGSGVHRIVMRSFRTSLTVEFLRCSAFSSVEILRTRLIPEIESAVEEVPVDEYGSAGGFQRAVQRSLESRGFSVVLEHPVERRGGRMGYIDIIARDPHGKLVVIELGALSLRKKSIEKLRLVHATRIIVLRRHSEAPSALRRIEDAKREVDAVIIPYRLRRRTDSQR